MIDPHRVMPGQEQAARDANFNEAMSRMIAAAEKIGEHTSQLNVHSEQLRTLNAHLEGEAKARESSDRKNRLFTLAMCFLTAALTLFVDNFAAIMEWARSLLPPG